MGIGSKMLEDLSIKQHFTLVKHPQTNEQAKATNYVMLRGLKWMLEETNGNWVEDLPCVL